MHRYYCEHPLEVESEANLNGPEVHHLLHVMRAKPGEQVTLFDGRGAEFVAQIVATSRKSVCVQVVERCDIDRELDFELTVGSALPKGDRQRFLIEKLVELGATRFVPLRTQRSVVKPNETVCQRLRKTVVEASKQCGRNRLMEIAHATSLADYLSDAGLAVDSTTRWIAHPSAVETARADHGNIDHLSADLGNRAIAVGPEGGFTDDEVELAAKAGWTPVSLGRRTLRIETAAVAIVARQSR